MRFEPVFLERTLNNRVSQTFLRHYALCPRSAFLYQTYKGQGQSAHMLRGSAVHEILERATREAIRNDEPLIPGEIVKAIAEEVLARYPIPIEEHDYVRECAYRWATEAVFDTAAVVAVEDLFVLDLGGFQVRCKIDYATLFEDGRGLYVADYKSSRAAPPFEEIARRRPDGSLAAKNFQLILYALALAYGRPGTWEVCHDCEGEGEFGVAMPDPENDYGERCPTCLGDGGWEYLARPDDRIRNVDRFLLEFVYPGIEDREGRMLRRPVSLTRLELDEYRHSFEGLLKRVHESEETGDWPAVVSDQACSICPAAHECPIPREIRPLVVRHEESAAYAAEYMDRINAEMARVRKAIKAFCAENEISLRYGNKVWEFVPRTTTKFDRESYAEAAQDAWRNSEPIPRFEDYTKISTGTDFKARDLRPDELEKESDG